MGLTNIPLLLYHSFAILSWCMCLLSSNLGSVFESYDCSSSAYAWNFTSVIWWNRSLIKILKTGAKYTALRYSSRNRCPFRCYISDFNLLQSSREIVLEQRTSRCYSGHMLLNWLEEERVVLYQTISISPMKQSQQVLFCLYSSSSPPCLRSEVSQLWNFL